MSKLSREQCENRLKELWREMWEVYKQYNPQGKYLTAGALVSEGRTTATIWNSYYDSMSPDAIHSVNVFTRFEEGEEEIYYKIIKNEVMEGKEDDTESND